MIIQGDNLIVNGTNLVNSDSSISIDKLKINSVGGYANMTGGLVFETPIYSEYQFRWDQLTNHTTTLTCGSYFMAEILYTAHQSNGGTDYNEYVRGKWSNNHTSHIWTEFEHSGDIAAMTTTFTVSDNSATTGATNTGKLVIQETYAGGGASYMWSTLTVRVYNNINGWGITHI